MNQKFIMGAVVGFAAAWLLLESNKNGGAMSPVQNGGSMPPTTPRYYPDTPAQKPSKDKWNKNNVAGFFARTPLPAKYGTLGAYKSI